MKISLIRLDAATSSCTVALGADPNHPNSLPFEGTLLILDQPSTRAPNGSDGHKILVPTEVARDRMGTLIAMGVNYATDLNGHAPRRKVGVITNAWIVGNKLKVRGTIWKKDFPEAVDDIKGQLLGMSMELADITIRDKNEAVWNLEDFYFTGATILWPERAAYQTTALAASAAKAEKKGDSIMPTTKKKVIKDPAAAQAAFLERMSASVGSTVQTGLAPLQEAINGQTEVLRQIAASLNAQTEEVAEPEADELEVLLGSGEEEDDDEISASGKKDDPEDDDDDSEDEDGEDGGDDDEEDGKDRMKADSSGVPGKLNNQGGNKGRKTTVTAGNSRAAKLVIQASGHIKTLNASLQQEIQKRRRLQNKVSAMEAQIENFSRRVERKSLSASATSLLERGGADVRELLASGGSKQLSTGEVDAIFNKAGMQGLDPTMRIAIKNELIQAGIMDQGVIRRVN